MATRLQGLWRRYEAAHLVLRAPARVLRDSKGAVIGQLELAELRDGRLHLRGWAHAASLTLQVGAEEVTTTPAQPRARPSLAQGSAPPGAAPAARPPSPSAQGEASAPPPTAGAKVAHVGFELFLPLDWRELAERPAPVLRLAPLPGAAAIPALALPIPHQWRRRLLTQAAFLRDLVLALPAGLGWLVTRDPRQRHRLKNRFGLAGGPPPAAPRLSPSLLGAASDTGAGKAGGTRGTVTVVLPVHNAHDLLIDCLARLERNTDHALRLILIEDCSTDARIRPFLRAWVQARPWAELIEPDSNLGFVGAANLGLRRALEQAPQGAEIAGPVVLLNSDALVPPGWAGRLLAPFALGPQVASVTPMSNDAELLSVPVVARRCELRPGQAEAIDRAAQLLAPDATPVEMPTGVGFCMALGRDWLQRVGLFDPAFGRGYGEEVDWCRRAAALGGRHLAQPRLFVEHRGGASFGLAEKQARIAQAGRLLARRYPDFDAQVQRFLVRDPLLGPRLALGLAHLGSRDPTQPVPVYLAHDLGGGAELYLQQRLEADLAEGAGAVVLRVGTAERWQLELVTPEGRTLGQCADEGLLRRLLDLLPRRHLVYSCGVGDPDPVALPELLLSLLAPGEEAELLFHDYFPLSPSYTLLDADGVYRGPPTQTQDAAHATRRPDGSRVSLAEWQEAWKRLAARAELVAFSNASARIVAAVWPDLESRIRLRPHRLHTDIPRLAGAAAGARPPVLGVLGNIGRQKGAGVLVELAAGLGRLPPGERPGLALLGTLDPAFRLPRGVRIHGRYAPADLALLARRYGISHWLIPSIWPETFCYTAQEALATGLPVLAFDIGAQGEAVASAPNGILVPYGNGSALTARVLQALRDSVAHPVAAADAATAG